MPALPLDEAGKFVAGAYVVFLALLLVYVGIMAAKLARIARELRVLAELAEEEQRRIPDRERPGGGQEAGAGSREEGDRGGLRASRIAPDGVGMLGEERKARAP